MREFPERKNFLKQHDRLTIMSVGRLIEKKGFEFLIQAMRDVIDKHPHVVLRIYGDGQLKERLNSKTEELNLSKNVFIKGS